MLNIAAPVAMVSGNRIPLHNPHPTSNACIRTRSETPVVTLVKITNSRVYHDRMHPKSPATFIVYDYQYDRPWRQ